MIGLALARLVALVGLSGEYSSIVLDHLHAFNFFNFCESEAQNPDKITERLRLHSDFVGPGGVATPPFIKV
jgi:hypothetical protein